MFVGSTCDVLYRKGSMDSFHDTSIHDIAKTAERCIIGFGVLYQQTKLSMEENFCTTQKALFSRKEMEDHGSDADDEITDVSGECLSSSNEFCDTPKDYYISSGTKPLSLVIRRCSTPTTENNSLSVVKRNSNVSSVFTKECESISDREVLNSDKKMNVIPFQKHVTVTTNAASPNSHSVVIQECRENVINVNDGHVKISAPHTVESDHLMYVDDSTLQPSNPVLEKYCNDDVDGNIPLSPICSREVCHRLGNDHTNNRNQDLQCLLGSLKTVQSLIHTYPSERCKQKVEVPNHSSFVEILKEDVAGNVVKIMENEGYQELYAVDTIRYESKIPTDEILDTNLFHIRKELSKSGEMCNLNLQTQGEPYAIGEKSVVESSVVESLINEAYDVEEIAIVNNSLKFQSNETVLLQVQRGNVNELGNQTERVNEVNTTVNHDVEITASRNVFDEDHAVCAGDFKHEKTEVSVDGSETAMVTATDTVKSETHVEIVSEPLPLQNIDNTLQKIEMTLQEDASEINGMKNATVSMSPISVGCALSSTQAENSENSHLMICTQKGQTVSVGDSAVQKCVQTSFDDVESTVSHGPKRQIPLIGLGGVLITAESEKVRSVNIKAEDETNMVHSPVLAGELAENVVESADSHRDRLYKVSKTDHVQSSVHNSSLLVQLHTEDALDCYNDVPSGTVFAEHSPLLFSSDDENSYYTETINNEQETRATTSNYGILTVEQKKLHQLQEALLGVPPPPSVTIPQLDVTDILRLLKENKSLMILADTESESDAEAVKSPAAPLKPSTVEQIKNCSWPESKSCYRYGIQYNRGRISEEFEMLCQKLQERFVGKETTSSCNIWFNCDTSNKVSNVTSRHRSTGHSPGRRLSHLARRKRTFSGANFLNSVADSRHSAVERRLIKVEKKKTDHKQRFKNYQPHKQAPSVDSNRLQQTKRALFKSPPGNLKGVFSASKTRSGSKKNKSAVDQTRAENCKCVLWPSKDNAAVKKRCDRALTSLGGQINVCGKRRREEGGISLQHKCPRRLLFGSAAAAMKGESDFMTAGDSSHIRTRESKPQMSVAKDLTCGLSEVHRKKLLWAVAETLRGEGISMNHPLFRPYATSLVRLVRNVMPDLNSKRAVSTSDLMLQLAKEHIKDVMKQQTEETKLNSRT